jgi:hypothetical protein
MHAGLVDLAAVSVKKCQDEPRCTEGGLCIYRVDGICELLQHLVPIPMGVHAKELDSSCYRSRSQTVDGMYHCVATRSISDY